MDLQTERRSRASAAMRFHKSFLADFFHRWCYRYSYYRPKQWLPLSDYLRLRNFQPVQMIRARTIQPNRALRSVRPIKRANAVPATFLTMALLLSVMYCQRGIRDMVPLRFCVISHRQLGTQPTRLQLLQRELLTNVPYL